MRSARLTVCFCSILSILALAAPSRAATHPQATGSPLRAPSAGPSARWFMGLADDRATGQVVLFGGYDQSGNYFGDTWTWDGRRWTQQHPVDSPSPRAAMGMAYDRATGQVVLFGGTDAFVAYGDTWTWDGTNWNLQHPSTSPLPANGVGIAFDPPTQMLVMVASNSGITWSWDGTNWNAGTPNTLYRRFPSISTLGPRIVFFGGDCCFEPIVYFHDTWVYNGSTWTKRDLATHPGNRSRAGVAFDPAHRHVVLFGGQNDHVLWGDTWTFDGRSWTRLSPPSSPSPRSGFGMVYDSTRHQTILFGGVGLRSLLSDTWTWDGFTWTCVAGCA
jgi:hypothetical protein